MKLIDAAETAQKMKEAFDIPMYDLVDVFAEISQVDAQPVVHGKWENVNPVEVPLYRCSVCGHTPTVIKTNFCPDCGARMDGEDNAADV